MKDEQTGFIAARFARLSTAVKMLLFLGLGLLPLGLIAILASAESARENAGKRTERAQTRLAVKAQRIDTLLTRSASTIRAASAAISLAPVGSGVCQQTLQRLGRAQTAAGSYALFTDGNRIRCATPGYTPTVIANPEGRRSHIEIGEDGRTLRFILFGDEGTIEGTGEFTREAIAELTNIPGTTGDFDLRLSKADRTMLLHDSYEDGPLARTVTAIAPVADGRLHLRMTLSAPPINALEVLMILLPVMMWIGAAILAWIIVDRLLLRPLARMQMAVSAYRPGDSGLAIPDLATPALEIGALGRAFNEVTQTIARHEAELEAGIERQKKLVREVHHRVKNNLQVVASLLNIHARGAANEEVAAAYASIQRRVDALAVVHRNHYAELEENRGVAIKPLISELAANLRATAPAPAARMTIKLGIEPYYVTQDVAVSVAFLITEIVEFAMFCGASSVVIALSGLGAEGEADGGQSGGTARLSIETESLRTGQLCDEAQFTRFDRIVTGLSRQLRSKLDRDPERGRLSVDVSVIEKAES